jgi:hypothetical protein
MSDIFREVDEEVRRDKAAKLWKRYQTPVFVTAFLIVAATGAWTYYNDQRVKTAEEANVRYQAASVLARDGKKEEAIAAFEAIAKDGPKGYSTLARLRAAEELALIDKAKAVAAFDAISDDKNVDKISQEVARLRGAMLELDGGDSQKNELRLGSLAASNGPFRFSAQEWLALDALETGDYDEADRVFNLILSDQDAPHAMRQRAAIYQALLQAVRGPKPAATEPPAASQEAPAPASAEAVPDTAPPPSPAPQTQ